ncbi:MAG: bifunctional hydroxymethylpyrimidine kinase/phosphomethylpyrimidine kinase [Bacteroidaceae bacterium]|jgi:hydroxymethylpyrimidine/phosphomethylpyrimidine kinase|nr:bifunctional hydroxymethylpyrimidine kinase/phosphomethylpyrimidine kinase [Bacteroidaceae bacterium]MCI6803659.1 bifunctional hydroxymethylpyrimidine kinase/phosphomethylpyrimidine kinase [Prevotellaceae bacterium]MBS7323058.1 bifunctional hydroxymethylpyrimidine kinase/phosphomethylpyrimidine kinase [Bacteroidaceae bacterium]MDD6014931.1 bifunctional hydroxymethylpyrimidine kinase/phosphomethylpyrimidine kinase [Prevotellaceae bacterium]MDD7526776.1 bifunctional hydroxymethylpyrimidine kin
MKKQLNIVFLIAGSEPLGSAGMQADIKAITACGGYAACALTGIVDEDTRKVKSVTPLPAELVVSQAESFLGDVGAQCIKTGVLPTAEIIDGVAELLKRYPNVKKVIDPVIVDSNGVQLVSNESIDAYKEKLFPIATLITPNFREAEVLLKRKITNISEDIKELGQWGNSVIVKSMESQVMAGRSMPAQDMLSDFLYNAETGEVREFRKRRIATHNVNGTGDSFSSAIATYLAKGYGLNEAVEKGEEFISKAIALGAEYEFGHGYGPVHPCFMEDKVLHERIYN